VEVVEIQSESLVRGVFHSRHTKNPIIFPFYGLDLLYANWNGWTIVHETPLPLTRLQAFTLYLAPSLLYSLPAD
jgi:hypothetical protein